MPTPESQERGGGFSFPPPCSSVFRVRRTRRCSPTSSSKTRKLWKRFPSRFTLSIHPISAELRPELCRYPHKGSNFLSGLAEYPEGSKPFLPAFSVSLSTLTSVWVISLVISFLEFQQTVGTHGTSSPKNPARPRCTAYKILMPYQKFIYGYCR